MKEVNIIQKMEGLQGNYKCKFCFLGLARFSINVTAVLRQSGHAQIPSFSLAKQIPKPISLLDYSWERQGVAVWYSALLGSMLSIAENHTVYLYTSIWKEIAPGLISYMLDVWSSIINKFSYIFNRENDKWNLKLLNVLHTCMCL